MIKIVIYIGPIELLHEYRDILTKNTYNYLQIIRQYASVLFKME